MVLATKLFFLAVRQVSKPLAGVAKQAAANSENFRGVMAFIGRGLHRMDLQVSRVAEGKALLKSITTLPEERAVVRGADLVSELVIYSVAGATVYYEYNLAQQKDKAKTEKAAAAEALNEQKQWEAFERNRDEIQHLQKRLTLMQEELQLLRTEAARESELRRSRRGWLW